MYRLVAISLSILLTASVAFTVSAATGWQAKVDTSVVKAVTLGSADFLVYLHDKADLSNAKRLPTKRAKGIETFRQLTATAAASQAPLIDLLKTRKVKHRSFWVTNAVVVYGGDLDLLRTIASRGDVANVFAIGKGRLHEPVERGVSTIRSPNAVSGVTAVEPSLNHVKASQAWALGYKGQGVVVAGADTGVRWTHRAIKNQYRGFDPATGTADHNYNWRDAWAGVNSVCPLNSTVPCDDNDHGTHTVGTIVGDDGGANQIGVAPEAEWIACKNMAEGWGVVPTYMDCMQWFIAPTDLAGNNPDPTKSPDVVNNSWGCVEVCAPPPSAVR